MRMLLALLSLMMLSEYTVSQGCSTGCLRCSRLNQCTFCDPINNYYINGTQCVKSSISNCLILAQDGFCVRCAANYYYNLNANNCLRVSAAKLTPGCIVYNTQQQCVGCDIGYYSAFGYCLVVQNPVQFCAIYAGDGNCATCVSGYVFSPNRMTCVSVTQSDNCAAYSETACLSCKNGYFLNNNLYFTLFKDQSQLALYFTNELLGLYSPLVPNFVCQRMTVFNCKVYINANICSLCNDGFYLSRGVCFPNPTSPLLNCAKYTDLTTCAQCNNQYYLSKGNCTAVTPIPNCLVYNGSASATVCVQCENMYYLSENSCVQRKDSALMTGCAVYNKVADLCSLCIPGYNLTSDNLACLPSIANCVAYNPTTKTSNVLTCATCAFGYALIVNTTLTQCVFGTIKGCSVYVIQGKSCLICTNGYYLTNGTCSIHAAIQKCSQYSQSKPNSCVTCEPGYFPFQITTTCRLRQTLNGCQAYSADGLSCVVCSSNFYRNQNGFCTQLPVAVANCNNYNGIACNNCTESYLLNGSSSSSLACIKIPDYVTTYCAQRRTFGSNSVAIWSATSTTISDCFACSNYAYAYSPLQTESICVKSNDLLLYSGYTAIDKCVRYGLNYAGTKNIICMECMPRYFLMNYEVAGYQSTSLTCSLGCSFSSGLSVILDDLFGFVNICVMSNTAGIVQPALGCQYYARTSTQNNNLIADFTCVTAKSGNFLFYANPAAGYSFEVLNVNTPTVAAAQSTDFLHGIASQDPSFLTVTQNYRPTLFNYKGLVLSTITMPSNPIVSLSNCDILWTIGDVQGSAYQNTPANTFNVATGPITSCLRCFFGFQTQFLPTTQRPSNFAVPTCQQMSGTCQSSILFGGLPSYLNAVVSCHVCTAFPTSTLYPTVYMDIDGATAVVGGTTGQGNFIGFTIPYLTVLTVTPNHGFRCTAAQTNVQINDTPLSSSNSVLNCAVYGVLTTFLTSGGAASFTYSFCLACAAGTLPIYFGTTGQALGPNTGIPGYAVTSCVSSLNCDTTGQQSTFNGCSKCLTPLASNPTTFYSYSDFTLANCLPTKVQNCFILGGTLSATAPNSCQICQSGYYLNMDGSCEAIILPNVASQSSFSRSYFLQNTLITGVYVKPTAVNDQILVRIHYLLSFVKSQYGVDSCNNGYVRAPIHSFTSKLCVVSPYITLNSFPINSQFIPSCIAYNTDLNANGKLVCSACANGFTIMNDGSQCVAVIQNCKTAFNSGSSILCYKCQDNYYNSQGNCVFATIAYCSSYVGDTTVYSTSPLKCSKCMSGFSLSSDGQTCTRGFVFNCDTYAPDKVQICVACLPNNVLVTFSATFTYCYPIPSNLNCQSLQTSSGNSGVNTGTLSCTACSQNSANVFGVQYIDPAATNQIQTVCMAFNLIANCMDYDQYQVQVNQNTFSCTKCSSGFWLDTVNNRCVLRVNMPYYCTSYEEKADRCSVCSSNAYLSSDGLKCIMNPTGIAGCVIYASQSVCSACQTGQYLLDNKCLNAQIQIANCKVYSGDGVCLTCQSGFFLYSGNECQKGNALNCLTMRSKDDCQTCSSGYGLVQNQGRTDCVQITIPNCIEPTSIAPFQCISCQVGYYPNDGGTCNPVTTIIPGCLMYDSIRTCKLCVDGWLLSPNKEGCEPNTVYKQSVDKNCNSTQLKSPPSCAICLPGYQFQGGVCVQSTSIQNGANQGCLISDPNNNGQCVVCSSGFVMTPQGRCLNKTSSPISIVINKKTKVLTAFIILSLALIWR